MCWVSSTVIVFKYFFFSLFFMYKHLQKTETPCKHVASSTDSNDNVQCSCNILKYISQTRFVYIFQLNSSYTGLLSETNFSVLSLEVCNKC